LTEFSSTQPRGSLSPWLQLAAELERRSVRPTAAEIRDLSKETGLDIRTVRSAVKLRFEHEGKKTSHRRGPTFGQAMKALVTLPINFLYRFFPKHPYLISLLFTVVYLIVCSVLFVMLALMTFLLSHSGMAAEIASTAMLILIAAGYAFLQGGLIYRSANIRLAFRLAAAGSAVPIVILLPILIAALTVRSHSIASPLDVVLLLVLAYATAFMILGTVFGFAATAGAYAETSRRLKAEREADRQTLIRRVFELTTRLEGTENGQAAPTPIVESGKEPISWTIFSKESPRAIFFSSRLWLTALLFAVAFGFLQLGINLVWAQWLGHDSRTLAMVQSLLFLLIQSSAILFLFSLGTLVGRLKTGLLMAVMCGLGDLPQHVVGALFSPKADGLASVPNAAGLMAHLGANFVWSLLIAGVPLLAGTLTGLHAQNLERERRLAANDKKVLTDELEQLRSSLNRGSSNAIFMSIDVVGSTKLKEGADPLAVEYSFTEFHRYIANRVIGNNGVIHSTAGDGAIAAFPEPDHALAAGLAIQQGLAEFNERQNTLDEPFKLRIGIHSGSVSGEAQGVSFSQVIDIAAHVEKVCPPGGVAMTHATVQMLTNPVPTEDYPWPVDDMRVAVTFPQSS
jgi:class 3 adenylate cyclase